MKTVEECDDSNGEGGDGCSADCKVEPGYMCAIDAEVGYSKCREVVCGDGIRMNSHDGRKTEICDDGETRPQTQKYPTTEKGRRSATAVRRGKSALSRSKIESKPVQTGAPNRFLVSIPHPRSRDVSPRTPPPILRCQARPDFTLHPSHRTPS